MKKFIRGFGYAFKGIGYAVKTQLNFRVHIGASVLAVILGVVLGISVHEWLWIMLCIAIVLVSELVNTAIELLTDLVSPEYNKMAGIVKDLGAGAVLIAAIFALATGVVVFLPKLLLLLKHVA